MGCKGDQSREGFWLSEVGSLHQCYEGERALLLRKKQALRPPHGDTPATPLKVMISFLEGCYVIEGSVLSGGGEWYILRGGDQTNMACLASVFVDIVGTPTAESPGPLTPNSRSVDGKVLHDATDPTLGLLGRQV